MPATTPLFGPDRIRPGYPDTEWSVWITGMDDVLDQPDLTTALMVAAEHNATAVSIRDTSSDLDPVTHAVVLHHGYAWQRPKAIAEQHGPFAVHLVVEIRCPVCNYALGADDDGIQIFDTEADAAKAAVVEGWHELADGRVICDDDDEEHAALLEAEKPQPVPEEIPGQLALDPA